MISFNEIAPFISPYLNITIIEQLIADGYIDGEFVANYTAVEGYDKPDGKFPNNLGNVAVVDCSSLGIQIGKNLDGLADKVEDAGYFAYAIIIREVAKPFYTIDFCQSGMTIEGVLNNAVNLYVMDNSAKMKSAVIQKGRDLMEKLTLQSKTLLATPMLDSLKQVDMPRVFLTSSLLTIVFFLGILSV